MTTRATRSAQTSKAVAADRCGDHGGSRATSNHLNHLEPPQPYHLPFPRNHLGVPRNHLDFSGTTFGTTSGTTSN